MKFLRKEHEKMGHSVSPGCCSAGAGWISLDEESYNFYFYFSKTYFI